MSLVTRHGSCGLFLCVALLAITGCATSSGSSLAAGKEASIEGAIASIDTQPWTYDGNAVIQVDTEQHGRVAVQLPARWNLCKAEPMDVASLSIGMRINAVGTVLEEGGLVVCQDASHRLAPID